MRRWIEPAVRRWWRGEGGLPGAVLDTMATPLEMAFAWGVGRRNRAYDDGVRPTARVSLPVISVGNLTVGGTGKTPVTAWLAERLAEAGLRPGIVLRGYGSDELRLHRHWNPTLPSAAAVDRHPAIERVRAAGARVVLLDDGFQHRALARDLDLVLVSTEQTLGERPRLLPRGPYREPWSALRRADAVLLTHRMAPAADLDAVELRVRATAPAVPVYRVRLGPAGWRTADGDEVSAPDGPVLAVAAIADPEGFAALLRQSHGLQVDLAAFPDHHEYSELDWVTCRHRAAGRTIVITEKDAVKLRPLIDDADVRVLALSVEVVDGDVLMNRIRTTVAR